MHAFVILEGSDCVNAYMDFECSDSMMVRLIARSLVSLLTTCLFACIQGG